MSGKDVPGSVMFYISTGRGRIARSCEEGGAALMVKEGVMDNPEVNAIFLVCTSTSATEVGTIKYKSGSLMAAADGFTIKVKRQQTHGSSNWFRLIRLCSARTTKYTSIKS